MKKLLAIAILVVMLCLSGLVMSGTALAQQCVDNGDGTVTDNGTGLMWQKAGAGPMNWDAAMSYCSNLSLAGHSDWRLPSEEELQGLYNSSCKNMMDVIRHWYWSSTAAPSSAYLVDFYGGKVSTSNKSSIYYVRAVRGAQ